MVGISCNNQLENGYETINIVQFHTKSYNNTRAIDTPHTEGEYSTINLMRRRDITRTRDDKDTDVGKLGNTTINLTSTRDITRTRGKEDSDQRILTWGIHNK